MDKKMRPHFKSASELKHLRGQLEPQAFAKMLELEMQTYYRYERGERKVPDSVLKLARILVGQADLYIKDKMHPDAQSIIDVGDILKSGDPILIPALRANIEAFKRSLDRERQIHQVLVENVELKQRMSTLEGECVELRKKISALEEALKLLSTREPTEAAA